MFREITRELAFAMPLHNQLLSPRPVSSSNAKASAPSTEPRAKRCAGSCRSCKAVCRLRSEFEFSDEANAH